MTDVALNHSQYTLLRSIAGAAPDYLSLSGAERNYQFHAAQRLARRGLLQQDAKRPRWFKLTDAGWKTYLALKAQKEPT